MIFEWNVILLLLFMVCLVIRVNMECFSWWDLWIKNVRIRMKINLIMVIGMVYMVVFRFFFLLVCLLVVGLFGVGDVIIKVREIKR